MAKRAKNNSIKVQIVEPGELGGGGNLDVDFGPLVGWVDSDGGICHRTLPRYHGGKFGDLLTISRNARGRWIGEEKIFGFKVGDEHRGALIDDHTVIMRNPTTGLLDTYGVHCPKDLWAAASAEGTNVIIRVDNDRPSFTVVKLAPATNETR